MRFTDFDTEDNMDDADEDVDDEGDDNDGDACGVCGDKEYALFCGPAFTAIERAALEERLLSLTIPFEGGLYSCRVGSSVKNDLFLLSILCCMTSQRMSY